MLKIDKKLYKNIDIYYIGYITIKKNDDGNQKVLRKYADVWDGIKKKIKAINSDKENDYGKDYVKIKFNSDDDLPLNKLLKFRLMTIIIRCVFSEDGKLYPQLFLDTLYELV